MRLVTCEKDGRKLVGVWIDGDRHIVDLALAARLAGEADAAFTDMQNLIEGGERAWDSARRLAENPADEAVFETAVARLLSPLPRPVQVRDFLCFEDHLINAFAAAIEVRASIADDPAAKRAELEASGMFTVPKVWYERPIYYTSSSTTVCGTDTDVIWPAYSNLMDYELEFAAVIGKTGKNISHAEARDHIFGYTIFNDFSARDEQMIVMEGKLGPGKGKEFDNANVFGPCIVTADEIPDAYALAMRARVNGEQWSSGTSASMHYRFEDLIAYTSRAQTLYAGEIFCSGTVGTGCGVELQKFLKSGDVVELDVENIGVLRNRVLREA
ncbi:fumarylacetoacetate hydrolase family protein [Govanella unica]|uniref:Fumarylacetoacetate hydrolase family protein n=1 Tax=Govanella unica TaxID=2975056 RepID=A0A9X3TZ33_9PROT|nr:fumarylacetoacetate hydrolase family protein [Govania unica]MDA5194047.1 fumarylacetoacetate hydrolase family protein [Govania unica]